MHVPNKTCEVAVARRTEQETRKLGPRNSVSGGEFESDQVLQNWVDRLEAARRRRFAGLRLTGNPSWLEKPEWHGFMEYEAAVDAIIGLRRMLAICSYTLSKCDALQIMDVISNHEFALVKRAGEWEVIAHEDTVIQKKRLRAVLEALPVGVALIDAQGGKVESNAAFDRSGEGRVHLPGGISVYLSRATWLPTIEHADVPMKARA